MKACDKAMINRIKLVAEKQCNKCKYQEGKYCSWWRDKGQNKIPPCQK